MDIGVKTLENISKAHRFNKWMFEGIEPYIGKDVLEVGAGIGNMTQFLLDKGEITCLDISARCIDVLKGRFSSSGRVSVLLGDISNLDSSWKGRNFDTIVCLNVLEHVENDEEALGNMATLLGKDGRLILLVPAYRWLYGSLDRALGHYRRYKNTELREKYKRLALTLEKGMYFNALGTLGWFLNGRILRRKILPLSQMKIYDLTVPLLRFVESFLRGKFGLSLVVILRKT